MKALHCHRISIHFEYFVKLSAYIFIEIVYDVLFPFEREIGHYLKNHFDSDSLKMSCSESS